MCQQGNGLITVRTQLKAGAVAALGGRRLFVRILPAYGIVIAAGVLMLLYRYLAF
jgi:hypothetical protein